MLPRYPREVRTLGDRIRKRRKDLRLSQRKLAKLLGVDKKSVENWEGPGIVPARWVVPRINATADQIACFFDPIDCARAWPCREESFRAASAKFGPRGGLADPKDAFRHCYWNCCMAKRIGVTEANKFGDSHEEFPQNTECDKQMDLWNNAQGRGPGPLPPGGDCASHCSRANLQNRTILRCTPCTVYLYYPTYYDEYGFYLPPP